MNGHLRLKNILVTFWDRFGGRKNKGVGFAKQDKLAALIELSQVKIPYVRQQPIEVRRDDFNESKTALHPWRRFGNCFACGAPATDRHHIVQLQNGGINSKKNLVSLCANCHGQIHPWMATASGKPD